MALQALDKGPAPQPTAASDQPNQSEPVHDASTGSPKPTAPATSSDLTPIRAHYLKRALVSLQFSKELSTLTSSNTSVSVLSYLGPPFTPPPKGDHNSRDLVFFQFIFRQFFLTFPFLAAAPKNFFPQKLQPFVDSVIARNLSLAGDGEDDDAEEATRQKLLDKVEKHLSLLLGSAIKLAEKEEVVRLTQRDLDRLEKIAKRRRDRALTTKERFEINVIGVRTVVQRKHVRNRVHEEFLIRTKRPGQPDIVVSRRSGDFKTLAAELRKAHPEEDIRPPPEKNRTAMTTSSSVPVTPASAGFFPPDAGRPGPSRLQSYDSSESLPMTPRSLSMSQPVQRYELQREKNRLSLRGYLHLLFTSPVLASSPVLKHFLTDGPTRLTPEELEDARRREEADRLREKGKEHFDNEVKEKVEKLREALGHVKSDMLGKTNGLSEIFATIRATPNVRDLPPDYRAALEWGRISLASAIFQQFIASDTASEKFAMLKRLHGLMPYMLLKGILKISNPVAMVRGVLDLFLAQPFGGKSLLQRMFTTSLSEEVKSLQEDIGAVEEKVDDPTLCEKVRQFVNAPREFQDIYRADATADGCNLLSVILRSGERPQLSRAQTQRVARASRAHAAYLQRRAANNSDSDEGPEDEDGWLYEDLRILLRLYSRLRDREQLIALIFEGTTAELLKDIITIFYSPLAQVYKAASIADSLSDLQTFLNDLIKTVEQVELSSDENPTRTVQTFIDLVDRHQQPFYHFVHKVHSKGEGLFDSLMKWIELFLTFVREGLGEEFSLEYILPNGGEQRVKILEEVDKIALYHYKLKVAHEEKVKRRFGEGTAGGSVADAENEAAQALVDGVLNEMSFGDLVQGDAAEIADMTSSSEESSEEESTSEESDSEEDDDEDDDEDEDDEEEVFTTPRTEMKDGDHLFVSELAPSQTNSSKPIPAPDDAPPPVPPKSEKAFPLPPAVPPSSSKGLPPVPSPAPSKSDSPGHASNPTSLSHKVLQPIQTQKVTAGSSSIGSSSTPHRATPPVPAPRRAKRKAPIKLKEPELTAIPELLPIFIELIRPRLRPRSV